LYLFSCVVIFDLLSNESSWSSLTILFVWNSSSEKLFSVSFLFCEGSYFICDVLLAKSVLRSVSFIDWLRLNKFLSFLEALSTGLKSIILQLIVWRDTGIDSILSLLVFLISSISYISGFFKIAEFIVSCWSLEIDAIDKFPKEDRYSEESLFYILSRFLFVLQKLLFCVLILSLHKFFIGNSNSISLWISLLLFLLDKIISLLTSSSSNLWLLLPFPLLKFLSLNVFFRASSFLLGKIGF